ncbi:hypothetical protein [Streptomyces luteoverticillatus]|uniref:hypothetical protein n=1 Tax=Streptomyces luteoverticillatus TaxID=66425 RepID=UPI0013DFF11E|nr:hypothetical protein [Streptomyces luteoverticillatus]
MVAGAPTSCRWWLELPAAAPVPEEPEVTEPLLSAGLPLSLGFPVMWTFCELLLLPLLTGPLTQARARPSQLNPAWKRTTVSPSALNGPSPQAMAGEATPPARNRPVRPAVAILRGLMLFTVWS